MEQVMCKFKTFIGIDVSKDTLAVSVYESGEFNTKEFAYNKQAITKELIKPFINKKDSTIFLMEATGVYHTKLAYQLHKEGFTVSAINPLIIKSYSNSKLRRVKTDSSDSKLIAQYAYKNYDELPLFKLKSKEQKDIEDIAKAIDDINLANTALNNQIKALKSQAYYSSEVVKFKQELLDKNNKIIDKLKKLLNQKLKENFSKEYDLLNKIPGVGIMVSSMVIAIFNDFKEFDSAKKVCAFIGIAPSPYESGTSVKRRGRISKKGSPIARKVLYMATLSAIRHNKIIKEFYERLLQNGKTKMTAIVACMNKLMKIIFAVVKYKREFCENYVRV